MKCVLVPILMIDAHWFSKPSVFGIKDIGLILWCQCSSPFQNVPNLALIMWHGDGANPFIH